jgi:phosphatidylglycerophosphate synthase
MRPICMRPGTGSVPVKIAVIVLGASWRRDGLERVGGLSLLGRAVLSIADAGISRIAVVGSSPSDRDPELVARALAGRRSGAEVSHFPATPDAPRRIADHFGIPLASSVAVLSESMLIAPKFELDRVTQSLADVPAASSVPRSPALNDAERRRLERMLFDDIRKPMETDGVIAWFVLRRISPWLTRRLWSTPVSPNHISIVALLLGVASGPVVAVGGRVARIAGALLLVANVLLDCVDGEVARLTCRKSRLGQWLDTVGDDASLVSYLLGLGAAVPWLPFGLEPSALATAAAILFLVTSAYVYYVLVTEVGVVDTALFPHIGGRQSPLAYAMKRDFFTVLFLLLAVIGLEWVSLMLIAGGAVANAGAVLGSALASDRIRTAKLQ